MIKDFEKKYEKLLREAEKGPLVMLSSVERQRRLSMQRSTNSYI